jgi:DNA-binding MarR family transcriptional regulator
MRPELPDGLTDLHMVALACFAREPFATASDVADVLAVPVALATMLVAKLQAAGMIEPAPE